MEFEPGRLPGASSFRKRQGKREIQMQRNRQGHQTAEGGISLRPTPPSDVPPFAASSLVDEIQPIVNAVLRRLLGSDDPEYEDIVQSSLENVIATVGAGRYRGECPTSGWAAVIARNVAVDALRARSRDRKVFSRDQNDEAMHRSSTVETGPEHLADIHDRLRQVEQALSRLNQRKAAAVYLHDVLGYDLIDVAKRLGTSVAAAQSRLVRGRRELLGSVQKSARKAARKPGEAAAKRPSAKSALKPAEGLWENPLKEPADESSDEPSASALVTKERNPVAKRVRRAVDTEENLA
jgi:RNA polymerase sigma-70 factor (ECF subfamily)